jgi:hypothetical protein
MPLVTGTPIGNLLSQEEKYLEGAPYLYLQDYRAGPANNPDVNGYYWNMSGTTTYPIYSLGCIQDVKLSENVTLNLIRCDTVGDKAAIQKRNYLQIDFTLVSLLPLTITAVLMNMFNSTVVSGREYAGISKINNNIFYQLYAPKVYDEVAGYWIMMHLHKCQITGDFTWDLALNGHKLTGLKVTAFIDETKPANQFFGVLARFDKNALP